MIKIRKANCFDKFKLKKMISFLSTDIISYYTKVFMAFPFNTIHDLLPLNLKFLPESYVIEENKDLLGMVTIVVTPGNPYKLNISRLFLEHDCFNAGKQLLEFVISKYGAKGAGVFLAKVDDSYNDLLSLFIDGCGFRQCSSEQIWKMENIRFSKENSSFFRSFRNSDAQVVSTLFNDSVITHFKYSVSRAENEYLEPVFKGLKNDCKFKYVREDKNLNAITAYFSVTTDDNLNYVLDIASSPWHECCWEDILSFAVNQIVKRQKDFNLFIKVRKYTVTAENFENYLTEKGIKRIQNQIVLVKDFYKQIKEIQPLHRVVMFNEINEKPVF